MSPTSSFFHSVRSHRAEPVCLRKSMAPKLDRECIDCSYCASEPEPNCTSSEVGPLTIVGASDSDVFDKSSDVGG